MLNADGEALKLVNEIHWRDRSLFSGAIVELARIMINCRCRGYNNSRGLHQRHDTPSCFAG